MRAGRSSVFAIVFAALGLVALAANARAQQPFLPGHYEPALTIDGRPLRQLDEKAQAQVIRRTYATDDRAIQLLIEKVSCEAPRCKTVFENGRGFLNEQAKKQNGRFRAADDAQFRVEWRDGLTRVTAIGLSVPRAVMIWSYAVKIGVEPDLDAIFATLQGMANRQRYEDALSDNVEMGRWGRQIHDYARALQRTGRTGDAMKVLTDLVATSPTDYAAHMELVALTPDPEAKRASARAVLTGSEDAELVAKAEAALAMPRSSESLSALGKDEKGLQLILLPLAPSDPRLLIDAGKVYEKITGVPVKVRRLPEAWQFGGPDRLPEQRRMQQLILRQRQTDIDFVGWTRERYREELIGSYAMADPLTRFFVQDFLDKLDMRPAQYRVEPYVDRLAELLTSYRSKDVRTMYVGVTELNIYGGDANYVFSFFGGRQGAGVSILSYSMMMAKTLGEPFESRARLVERIAKELVPASLKALGIPRATDPTDPYSYSDSVERLAQKTLTLSPSTRAALDKFR